MAFVVSGARSCWSFTKRAACAPFVCCKKDLDFEELLERLDEDIRDAKERQTLKRQAHKRLVGSLLFYSGILYVIGAIVYFAWFWQRLTDPLERLLLGTPLLVFPVLVFLFRKALNKYYSWRIARDDKTLRALRKKMQERVDELIRLTDFEKTRRLIDRYSPSPAKRPSDGGGGVGSSSARKGGKGGKGGSGGASDLRKRATAGAAAAAAGAGASTSGMVTPTRPGGRGPARSAAHQFSPEFRKAMLPAKARTRVDKMIDWMVGEGPNNRYALICSECATHNGLALKEEYENIRYRCYACGHINAHGKGKDRLGSEGDEAAATTSTAGGDRRSTPSADNTPSKVKKAGKGKDKGRSDAAETTTTTVTVKTPTGGDDGDDGDDGDEASAAGGDEDAGSDQNDTE